jgi:hypothetical protein
MNAIRFVQAIKHISALAAMGAKSQDAKAQEVPPPGEQSARDDNEVGQNASVPAPPPVVAFETEESAHIVSSTVDHV